MFISFCYSCGNHKVHTYLSCYYRIRNSTLYVKLGARCYACDFTCWNQKCLHFCFHNCLYFGKSHVTSFARGFTRVIPDKSSLIYISNILGYFRISLTITVQLNHRHFFSIWILFFIILSIKVRFPNRARPKAAYPSEMCEEAEQRARKKNTEYAERG